jgi:hypothetical protein
LKYFRNTLIFKNNKVLNVSKRLGPTNMVVLEPEVSPKLQFFEVLNKPKYNNISMKWTSMV